MPKNEKKPMTVRLDERTHKIIGDRVKSGEFDSNADFIRVAVEAFLYQDRIFDKIDISQRALMVSQLDIIATVTGMTSEEKLKTAATLNEQYQDDIF